MAKLKKSRRGQIQLERMAREAATAEDAAAEGGGAGAASGDTSGASSPVQSRPSSRSGAVVAVKSALTGVQLDVMADATLQATDEELAYDSDEDELGRKVGASPRPSPVLAGRPQLTTPRARAQKRETDPRVVLQRMSQIDRQALAAFSNASEVFAAAFAGFTQRSHLLAGRPGPSVGGTGFSLAVDREEGGCWANVGRRGEGELQQLYRFLTRDNDGGGLGERGAARSASRARR